MLETLRDFFLHHGLDRTYWIAYSGGLDSSVLLSLCQTLQQSLPLRLQAIHINHGLHAKAKTWAIHCAHQCQSYGIPYQQRDVIINRVAGDSLEAVAREKRYVVFTEMLGENDVLLTAHHQEDQAETLLLQLLRGAGLKGLAAMPALKSLGRGFLARPLLSFSKIILEAYAKAQALSWIDDSSNKNTTLMRNFIRHDVLPLLKTRWPSVSATLSRSAKHIAEAQELLDVFALEICQNVKGSQENTLSVKKMRTLEPAQQKLVLRTWIYSLGYLLPEEKKIMAILKNVLTAAHDRKPCVVWEGAELRRYGDDLYLMAPLSPIIREKKIQWELPEPLVLSGVGILRALPVWGKGLRAEFKSVSVQFRQGGEKFGVAGLHRTLKNIFQEWKIPPWQRGCIPLIFMEEQLIAIPGYGVAEKYAARADEAGHEICLLPEKEA